MDHQDWNTITLKKKSETKVHNHIDKTREQKLDNTELGDIPRVSYSMAKTIQLGRVSKGFKTQKDLAVAIGVSQSLINAYESGKAIPETKVLQKLRRILGIKL